jgi:hypothetical protein
MLVNITPPLSRSTIMKTRTAFAAVTLSALALPLAGIAPATASHGVASPAVRSHGGCGGPAVWKMKAKPDNSKIELEAEVDSNRSGQVWDWTIKHNGSRAAKGSSTTHGVSGSFTVARRMANKAGTDTFVFRAVRRATGDVCRGTVSL